MKRGPRKVLIDEKLADLSAAYLAMWKAMESFDPKADRWSEPVSFGNRQERMKVAENAISRLRQRYGAALSEEQALDVQAFHEHAEQLINGASFGVAEAEFTRHVRRTGSSLADQSVSAAHAAER